jgi:hypothetical protein
MLARSRKTWLAVLVAGLLVFPLLVSSCAKEPDDSASLEGYWLSGGSWVDGFEIDGKNFSQYDDGKKTVSFAGTIEGNPDLTDETGILIIKVTDAGTWGKTVGAYLGISWKNLNDDGVSEASAYKYGSTNNSGVATLAEAKKEYTVANDYFGIYGEYNRE